MSLNDFLGILKDTAIVATKHLVVMQLVKQKRQTAMTQIDNIVKSSSAEQLDNLEAEFVQYAQAQHTPELRIRAIELYAWLKHCEFCHYRNFRGFTTRGDAID